jgi:plastocyanin
MDVRRARIVGSMLVVMLAGSMTIGAATTAGAATPREKGARVRIKLFTFRPNLVVVRPGEAVKVVNLDGRKYGIPHSLTSRDGLFDTEPFTNGTRKFLAPTTPGIYKWFCEIHPFMKGTLKVES